MKKQIDYFIKNIERVGVCEINDEFFYNSIVINLNKKTK